MTQSPGWFDFAVASPFAATEWLGLGPFCQPSRAAASRLRKLSPTPATMWAALDTIGTTGARLVSVLVWYHGVISREQLADETPGADPGDLQETIDRLVAAGLVTRSTAGGLALTETAASSLAPIGVSMADQNAITSDELGQVCQVVGIVRAPTRKQERIDALAAVFVDDRDRVLATLSDRARALLSRIADVGGPRVLDVASVGLAGSEYSLSRASTPRFAFARDRSDVPDEVAPLAELTGQGIVGLNSWDARLWIWREAWPLLGRPLFDDWAPPPPPARASVTTMGLRLPPLGGIGRPGAAPLGAGASRGAQER